MTFKFAEEEFSMVRLADFQSLQETARGIADNCRERLGYSTAICKPNCGGREWCRREQEKEARDG